MSTKLYESDYYAWTADQADALRRLAAERWNGPLDLALLAEEVEDLGKSERNLVFNQIERVIEHLLKLEHSPSSAPRRQWMISVNGARREIARSMTPSIRRMVEASLPELYEGGRRDAALGLRDHGEDDAAGAMPTACAYAVDDLLYVDWWPTNRHGMPTEG